ncbi:MAG: hypothetical protein A3J48_02195 [Candidatus Doudnabacteria bacterium RIFCSPHIGHO2_02_FULL_46_11]|uniref:DNA-directed DNA polymerase n=1 Tax=Candidatus Doudnabacteria bacterium RIFCSPHIGHO2_02_FULL_46_11 TaxID=1817832 RepID=A0A1F5P4R9_9BACT|nr:MAG: hypothetical protein A3J48_02195 [Candidatus Doudnabacteria bacterium RIFCSPHIGHO2_02_FULL_46_11]
MNKVQQNTIYFFYGPDTYRALLTLNTWKKVFQEKHGPNSVRELPRAEKPYLLSEIAGGASLFEKTTLTVVRDPFSESLIDIEDFINFAQRPNKNGAHILLWQRSDLDKRLSSTKKILELGKNDEIRIDYFDFLSNDEALNFIASEFKKKDLKIKSDAGGALLRFCLMPDGRLDSWAALNAVSQLAAYASGKESVSLTDVQSLIVPANGEDVFLPMLKSFAGKQKKEFLINLNQLIAKAESDQESLGILSSLFEQVKNMLAVLILSEQGKSSDEIDGLFEFKKGRSRYLLADARRFDKEILQELFDELLEIEYNVKKGKTLLASDLSFLAVRL